MKIYIPKLIVACAEPPQDRLRPKFGGLPWGFPVERWAICAECVWAWTR